MDLEQEIFTDLSSLPAEPPKMREICSQCQ